MKYFLIISIICSIGIQTVWTENAESKISEEDPGAHHQRIFKECLQELHLPVFKNTEIYVTLNLITYFNPGPKVGRMSCLLHCVMRKHAESRGSTLRAWLTNSADNVYERDDITKFTRDEIISKIDGCYAKEINECASFKCTQDIQVSGLPENKIYSDELKRLLPIVGRKLYDQ